MKAIYFKFLSGLCESGCVVVIRSELVVPSNDKNQYVTIFLNPNSGTTTMCIDVNRNEMQLSMISIVH